jgi:hypothetical protein
MKKILIAIENFKSMEKKARIKTVVHIVFDEDPFVKGSTDCTLKALALIRTKVAEMMDVKGISSALVYQLKALPPANHFVYVTLTRSQGGSYSLDSTWANISLNERLNVKAE